MQEKNSTDDKGENRDSMAIQMLTSGSSYPNAFRENLGTFLINISLTVNNNYTKATRKTPGPNRKTDRGKFQNSKPERWILLWKDALSVLLISKLVWDSHSEILSYQISHKCLWNFENQKDAGPGPRPLPCWKSPHGTSPICRDISGHAAMWPGPDTGPINCERSLRAQRQQEVDTFPGLDLSFLPLDIETHSVSSWDGNQTRDYMCILLADHGFLPPWSVVLFAKSILIHNSFISGIHGPKLGQNLTV